MQRPESSNGQYRCKDPDEYRSLYVALTDESHFDLPANLAARTLSNVKTLERQKPGRDYTDAIVATWGIIIALTVAVWAYVDLWGRGVKPGLSQALDAFREFQTYGSGLLASLSNVVTPVSHEITLVVMAGFVVYVILALDYIFLSHRPATS